MNDMPENVKDFVQECAGIVADAEHEVFTKHNEAYECFAESPIELLFVTALNAIMRANNMHRRMYSIGSLSFIKGVTAFPQATIGKYRVDFLLGYQKGCIFPSSSDFPEETKQAVVELDGHDFHEKDEAQRRHEKKRDRYLQKEGYTVFHYTGAEIVRDPFAAALECMSFLTGKDVSVLENVLVKHGGRTPSMEAANG